MFSFSQSSWICTVHIFIVQNVPRSHKTSSLFQVQHLKERKKTKCIQYKKNIKLIIGFKNNCQKSEVRALLCLQMTTPQWKNWCASCKKWQLYTATQLMYVFFQSTLVNISLKSHFGHTIHIRATVNLCKGLVDKGILSQQIGSICSVQFNSMAPHCKHMNPKRKMD